MKDNGVADILPNCIEVLVANNYRFTSLKLTKIIFSFKSDFSAIKLKSNDSSRSSSTSNKGGARAQGWGRRCDAVARASLCGRSAV